MGGEVIATAGFLVRVPAVTNGFVKSLQVDGGADSPPYDARTCVLPGAEPHAVGLRVAVD